MDNEDIIPVACIFAIIISLGAILLIPFMAYADVYHYEGDLPVPDNLENTLDQCFLTFSEGDTVVFGCTYIFTAPDIADWMYNYTNPIPTPEPEEQQCDPRETLIDGVCTRPEFITNNVTQYDRDEQQLQDKFDRGEELNIKDREYLEMLKLRGECEQGAGQAKGIQDSRFFVISELWINYHEAYLTGMNRDGAHAELSAAVQECLAQIRYMLPLLGDYREPDDYKSRQAYSDDIQPYHGDKAIIYNWTTIPTHDEPIDEHDLTAAELTSWEFMCKSAVSQMYKDDNDCPKLDLTVGFNLDGTCRDTTTLNEDGTGCIPIVTEPLTLPLNYGEQENTNKAYRELTPSEKVLLFKSDSGEAMFDDLQQQRLRALESDVN